MEPLARKHPIVGVSVLSVKSMIALRQSVLDQDRMDFTTVACSTYDEGCVVVSMEELTMPRVAGRQVHRDNVEAESASQYYQRSMFFSCINGLIENVLMTTLLFLRCFLSFLQTTRRTLIRLRAHMHWTISPMKLGYGEILSPPK